MNLVLHHLRAWRLGVAAALATAWLYLWVRWINYPQGAAAFFDNLVGFVGLGLAAWIAPIERRWLRIAIRIIGSIFGFVASLLAAALAWQVYTQGLFFVEDHNLTLARLAGGKAPAMAGIEVT